MKLTKEHADYLMALRDSGVTNMWGAAPYLQEYFDIPYADAKSILIQSLTLQKAMLRVLLQNNYESHWSICRMC